MRHQVKGRGLGRYSGPRMMLYRNLVTDLLRHEKITTTEAKAKEIRGMAEKMITLGKEGTLASRRRALAFITEESIVSKVFTELAPRYKDRSGGYTRIYKLGPRVGDGAPTARVELVV
jgi:large subunit ribosomal protein L17